MLFFDLLPLSRAAIVAKNNGYDWFGYVSPSGSSLKKGIDWLVPYMNGLKHIMNSIIPSLNLIKLDDLLE
ncbi:alginate lyase family protein [Escherichia coli]|uniref:alginate lyase family protein n=1 Tax=Escherichia coli TaxID=562 RepID=UPI0040693BE5